MLRAIFLLYAILASSAALAALPDFTSLVDDNASTIVNITTEQRVPLRSGRGGDLEELLRQLRPGDQAEPDFEEDRIRRRGGVGSGFIISADGYVITNHHVVANADLITVTLTDRREYEAEVIGTDELSDMALLKIESDNLNAVSFGDSDRVRVGEWVLAIGSPFGLEFSAAAGIVSAKTRSVPSRGTANYVAFIQTDVAINQGNSGGPLFNLAGEVIGINSQILSSTGGSNGISFAIPSNMALNVIEQLRESGTVNRGLLGVMIKDVDQGLAEAFGLAMPRGAFVDEVQPDSPAARAGVLTNDVIVGFNERDIELSSELPFYVGQVRPGAEAQLHIIRAGETLRLPVVVGRLPGTDPIASADEAEAPRGNLLGLEVTGLEPQHRDAGVDAGVTIEDVREGPARSAGLSSGDVIVALNHQDVDDPDDFHRIVQSLPERGYIPIRINRRGRGTTLVIQLR